MVRLFCCWPIILTNSIISGIVLSAKLKEGQGHPGDKSQSDKPVGDCKKSKSPTPCQCVCHSRCDRASAQPAVVDLTMSSCKQTVQPSHTASEHGK